MEYKTLEQLDKMNDKRLLMYFKSIRSPGINRCGCWSECNCEEEFSADDEYVEKVKLVLSERGHVKRFATETLHENPNTKDYTLRREREHKRYQKLMDSYARWHAERIEDKRRWREERERMLENEV